MVLKGDKFNIHRIKSLFIPCILFLHIGIEYSQKPKQFKISNLISYLPNRKILTKDFNQNWLLLKNYNRIDLD